MRLTVRGSVCKRSRRSCDPFRMVALLQKPPRRLAHSSPSSRPSPARTRLRRHPRPRLPSRPLRPRAPSAVGAGTTAARGVARGWGRGAHLGTRLRAHRRVQGRHRPGAPRAGRAEGDAGPAGHGDHPRLVRRRERGAQRPGLPGRARPASQPRRRDAEGRRGLRPRDPGLRHRHLPGPCGVRRALRPRSLGAGWLHRLVDEA